MHRRRLASFGVAVVVIGGAIVAAWTSDRWVSWFREPAADATEKEDSHAAAGDAKILKLSEQARKNLNLVSKPAKPQTHWRTIQVPGIIEDRPGFSDRGVVAPAVSVVSQIHILPGDTLKPGDRLFTLRLISEYIQNAQSELSKNTREIQIVKEQRARLESAAKSGALPESRIIELDNQLRRFAAAAQAYRQDLLIRGLTPEQVDAAAQGRFVFEIEVVAPASRTDIASESEIRPIAFDEDVDNEGGAKVGAEREPELLPVYEVQELKVDLGRQVQTGETLCLLSNHQSLFIEGHAFKREASSLEKAAQGGWPVQVEFAEDDSRNWPDLDQAFQIRHLANTVDPSTRTFSFFVPLINQSRAYQKNGRTFLVWRFRPGQRVRLHVPVEEMKDVIVLPAGAVAREGPEAFVFRQNGDLFERRPVHILHEDRLHVVIAGDGSIKPGSYLAQGAGASLNRVLKSQSSSGGLPPGSHVHADGSIHTPGAH